jgi:phosphatidylinositol alpha 1,6-mannosyltransferase
VSRRPRVAFFPDSFLEVNGVARTSRALVAAAAARDWPLCCVHAGARRRVFATSASGLRVELDRGRWAFRLDGELRFDLALRRHAAFVEAILDNFQPDVVHITGPNDLGQLGAYLARVRGIPVVASWHTNLHDFAAQRLDRWLAGMPARVRRPLADYARRASLDLVLDHYRMARVSLAPNEELAGFVSRAIGKPVRLMPRGVDTQQFSPDRRTLSDDRFCIGHVGRLSPEKGVRLLVDLERLLLDAGAGPFRFLIVGDGCERPWLRRHLRHAEFFGVLTGESLARAYARMDTFVFPSTTDTYGNVVLESFASGVPVIVSDTGGPRFLVSHGVNGFIAADPAACRDGILTLMRDRSRLDAMRRAARDRALAASWDRVFDRVSEAWCEAAGQRTPADDRIRKSTHVLPRITRLVMPGVPA